MLLLDYLRYRRHALSDLSPHSPLAQEFYQQVVGKISDTPLIQPIESRRRQLEADKTIIEVTDYGAGSRWAKSPQRRVGNMAKSAKKQAKWRKLLYRLVQQYCQNTRYTVLELGTSFGISTAYLATANKQNRILTLEGCPSVASIAAQTFEQLGLQQIEQRIGNIDETLPKLLEELPQVDVVFFDANHRYEPTLRYFNWCLQKATTETCFIFDDIYWSEEMKAAWQQIASHEAVTTSFDLFQLGIVFFHPHKPKENLVVKA